MQKLTIPHEFLVRWDDAGNLKGAHIVNREVFLDDAGVEQFSRFTDPSGVTLTDAALLASIAGNINTTALAQIDSITAAKNTAESQRTQAVADHAAAVAARDAAIAEKDSLAAQLTALQAKPTAPRFIKKWQLSAGMRKDDPTHTLITAFNAVIASLPAPVKELWDGSSGVEEDSPFLALAKAPPLGLTDAQIKSMFDRYPLITQADVLSLTS